MSRALPSSASLPAVRSSPRSHRRWRPMPTVAPRRSAPGTAPSEVELATRGVAAGATPAGTIPPLLVLVSGAERENVPVESGRGAAPALRPVRFPGPLAAPGVPRNRCPAPRQAPKASADSRSRSPRLPAFEVAGSVTCPDHAHGHLLHCVMAVSVGHDPPAARVEGKAWVGDVPRDETERLPDLGHHVGPFHARRVTAWPAAIGPAVSAAGADVRPSRRSRARPSRLLGPAVTGTPGVNRHRGLHDRPRKPGHPLQGAVIKESVADGAVSDRGLDPQAHPGDDEEDQSELDLTPGGEHVQHQQDPAHQQRKVARGSHRRGGGSGAAL